MQKNHALPVVAAAAAISLMGFGCNPFASVQQKIEQKVSEKVSEGAVGALTGGKVKMDADNNNFVFKDNKTGNSVSIGEDLKIPDDFPKAVPIYAGAKAKSVSVNRAGDKESSLTLRTDDAATKVADWYSETLKKSGWSEDSSTSMGKSEARSYKKGTEEITLLAFPADEEAKGSLVTLVYKPGTTDTTTDSENK